MQGIMTVESISVYLSFIQQQHHHHHHHHLLLLLLLLLLPKCQLNAQNAEVDALLRIKDAVGASSSKLQSWNTSMPGPCSWNGVNCSTTGHVTALNMSAFNLQGQLPKDSFTSLTELMSLDLSNNLLKSPVPSLSALPLLHDLNLTANLFVEAFPEDILSLTELVELRLSNNEFQGSVPEDIGKLQKLEQLWLGNNSFTSLPKSLSSLIHLTILTAWGNSDLKLTLPPEWGVWVNITYLNLHDIKLTGTLPSEWGANFTRLERLSLYQNHLEGSIPESWKSMTNLNELRMYTNKLSGIVPSWIGDIKNKSAKVQFSCNYLQGPYPTFFADESLDTWKGNCFDSDFGSHRQVCGDGSSCQEFFEKTKTFPIRSIIGIIIGVLGLVCVLIALLWWFKPFSKKKKRRQRNDQDTDDWQFPPTVRRFTFKEIIKATKSFSKEYEIGEGGFGKVYLARLDDRQVAIKRASDVSFQGIKEFRNELMLLGRLHHRHLVRLEGFCDDKDEQILIYEYMENGNLHHHLFDKSASTLNWYRRLEIALGVAQGLEYLHTFADPPVIHRDLKPSNILLDSNMVAKVSDFGISKANAVMDTHVSTRPAGTAGYLDPEYFLRRQLTTASDVYGYGVVLLELLTGQVAIDHNRAEDYNLVAWVKARLDWNTETRAIIDPRLGQDYPVDEYNEVLEIAVQCTKYGRNERPRMQVPEI